MSENKDEPVRIMAPSFRRKMMLLLMLQHRLEIIIEYRLGSVGSSDAILSIIIGYSFFCFRMHVSDVSLCFICIIFYKIASVNC